MTPIQIQWTCASKTEAKQIAKELVEKKWVACANIIPNVESIYLWEGKVEEGQEVKVLFKTTDEHFANICAYIVEHGSYDVPEVSKFVIAESNPQYLSWLKEIVNV